MPFKIDWSALAFLCIILPIAYALKIFFFRNATIPSLSFSRVNSLKNGQSLRERFNYIPKALYWTSLALLLSAFLDPRLILYKTPEMNSSRSDGAKTIPTEGIAIYLLLDQSGSMAQTVNLSDKAGRKQIPKIDLLKQVTEKFIVERSNDLIGLIYFARVPRVAAPLTMDHRLLVQDLKQLHIVSGEQNDGTSLGYAVFKAAHLIAATRLYSEELSREDQSQYQIKNAVIIAVTDGMQDPSIFDKGNRLRTMEPEEAAKFAAQQKIKLYVINIDPAFASEKYAPHRRQLQTITRLTGGDFFLASDGKDLSGIYDDINRLERSQIPQFDNREVVELRGFSFYPYLILAGMICIFFACILESFYFKSIP